MDVVGFCSTTMTDIPQHGEATKHGLDSRAGHCCSSQSELNLLRCQEACEVCSLLVDDRQCFHRARTHRAKNARSAQYKSSGLKLRVVRALKPSLIQRITAEAVLRRNVAPPFPCDRLCLLRREGNLLSLAGQALLEVQRTRSGTYRAALPWVSKRTCVRRDNVLVQL